MNKVIRNKTAVKTVNTVCFEGEQPLKTGAVSLKEKIINDSRKENPAKINFP